MNATVKQFPERYLQRQTEAARVLLSGLRDMGLDDDAELVADSIEGETGLREAIQQALDDIDDNDVLILGLKAKETQFKERREIIEARNERLRALIEQALVVADEDALRLPAATLSLRKARPSVIVDSEADVPSEFFSPQPPKLDKDALRMALDAGRAVPGVHLSNGGRSLSVRRK